MSREEEDVRTGELSLSVLLMLHFVMLNYCFGFWGAVLQVLYFRIHVLGFGPKIIIYISEMFIQMLFPRSCIFSLLVCFKRKNSDIRFEQDNPKFRRVAYSEKLGFKKKKFG